MATAMFRHFMASPLETQLKLAHTLLISKNISQKEAWQVLSIVRNANHQSPAIFEAYLQGTARRGDTKNLARGIELVTKLGLPAKTNETYLQLYAVNRNPAEAFKILDSMVADKKALDSELFSACLERLGTTRSALARFSQIWNQFLANGAIPDQRVRSLLIKQSADFGDAHAASTHLRKLVQEGGLPLRANMFAYVIGAYKKQNNRSSADYWLGEMKKHQVQPTVYTFNHLIDVDAKKGDVGGVRTWLKEMKKQGIKPDTITYNTIINGAVKQGDIGSVERWLEEMQNEGLSPNETTFAPMIDDAAKRGDMAGVQKWINQLVGWNLKPTLVVFHSLIMRACEQNNPQMVRHWLQEMEREGVNLDARVYVSIINLAVKMGDLQSARVWVGDMKRKRFVDEPYNALARAAVRAGDEKTVTHWLEEMKKSGVKPERAIFKFLGGETGLKTEYNEWASKFGNRTNQTPPVK